MIKTMQNSLKTVKINSKTLYTCILVNLKSLQNLPKKETKMGLDMYLSAKKYVPEPHRNMPVDEESMAVNNLLQKIFGIPSDITVSDISVRIAYWRKANQIHKWFVDRVQGGKDDCHEYDVSLSTLLDLVELCKQILAAGEPERQTLIQEKLPPASGFFFGGTDVDEWYYSDLQETIDQLSPVIAEDSPFRNRGWYFVYRSSW